MVLVVVPPKPGGVCNKTQPICAADCATSCAQQSAQ